MQPIINVRNLGKRYSVGERQQRHTTLRESLIGAVREPFERLRRRNGSAERETFWALENVNFDVLPGEVVGIIGRNGAGKSTLLKILSRITEPTTGRVDLYGRVGSLLEVGTGFHSELTGRENVYLNGAVLGMKKAEIDSKFDEIVAFAEVDRFIDTPVKRYSSGMQMRLAFAVAAHLEPEILVVDEVLAVGDVAFQKKCLGKIEDVATHGRTVLFVSHNMSVLRHLCSRGVLLSEGRVARIGRIDEAINDYLDDIQVEEALDFEAPVTDTAAYITRLCIRDSRGERTTRIAHSEDFTTEIEYVVKETISSDRLWWHLSNTEGIEILGSGDVDSMPDVSVREPGRYLATVRFPGGILNQGRYQYRIALASMSGHYCDYKYGTYFEVHDDSDFGSVNSGGGRNGVILLRLKWEEQRIS